MKLKVNLSVNEMCKWNSMGNWVSFVCNRTENGMEYSLKKINKKDSGVIEI